MTVSQDRGMSEDLRDKITAAIDRAEQVARAAASVPWEIIVGANGAQVLVDPAAIRNEKWRVGHLGHVATVERVADALHIALNDPAAVLRRCAADRRVLERHKHEPRGAAPLDDEIHCAVCGWVGGPGLSADSAAAAGVEPLPWVGEHWCDDIRDLAARYGIEVEA